MPILEQILFYVGLGLFFAGILFMHLRLRNKPSLALVMSFSFLVSWFTLKDWVFGKYIDLTSNPMPAAEWETLTPEQSAQKTAEAFSNYSTNYTFDTISNLVLLVSFLVFCAAFFLSARSIAVGEFNHKVRQLGALE